MTKQEMANHVESKEQPEMEELNVHKMVIPACRGINLLQTPRFNKVSLISFLYHGN